MSCTTILVGKNAMHDHSTVIARNDDGSFEAKRIAVMMPKDQPRIYRSVLSHVKIELPDAPLRYTYAPNVSNHKGTWPACGINEANVAMTATETVTSNPRVIGADPYVVFRKRKGNEKEVAGGIGEEDLVTLILPYIRSAREGVLRFGKLLETYGTYEANGVAFSDADEIWWMETIGGHRWIARRVPDDRVVIMPNQFGLDEFDFDDAYGEGKENLCSADLREFTEKYGLYTGWNEGRFNPRLAFGSRGDSDHIYNTPRGWFLARSLMERRFKWDGDTADYTPESNDIPWSFVPERRMTVEEIRDLLGSYYQGTPYNPYDKISDLRGKYRCIGVPNTDVCGILQIRGDKPKALQGVEWLSLGGSGFTACFPLYTQVESIPAYFGGTKETVSTDSMYWQSRLIAALTDAHFGTAILLNERYRDAVMNETQRLLDETDARFTEENALALLTEANRKIAEAVRKESDEALKNILGNASEHMKTRYHRGDH